MTFATFSNVAVIVALGAVGGALYHLHEDFHEFRADSAKVMAELQTQQNKAAIAPKPKLALGKPNCPVGSQDASAGDDDETGLDPQTLAAMEVKDRLELLELLAHDKDVLNFIESGMASEKETHVVEQTQRAAKKPAAGAP